MLQAAAAFGAGFLAQSSMQTSCAQAPTCTATPSEGGTSFKLSVRVHAASVPALAEPSRMLKLKMRLGAALAGAEKETEDADFAGPASSSAWFTLRGEASTPSSSSRYASDRSSSGKPCTSSAGAASAEWASWRFGDTLTFAVRACDLVDGGMRIRLRVQSDVCLGPVSVQMPRKAQEFGECVVDLRNKVLPVSVPSWSSPAFLGVDCEFEPQPSWETPALVFPLSHVSDSPHSGVEVSTLAKVALSFNLNVDPEVLMREVDEASKPLPYKVADHFAACLMAPLAPLPLCSGRGGDADEAAAWAVEAMSWGCAGDAVTPRPRERKQPHALPVLPKVPAACDVGLRKV